VTAVTSAVEFAARLSFDDLPADVVLRAKMCLADTLAAMIAGRQTASTRIAAELAAAWWPAPEARLIYDGARASASGAAFANAVAANALDIDDCGIYTWGHPGAQVVPAALALTDRGSHSGQDLLTAIVVGYEIAFRAGRCLNYELTAIASAERDFRGCGAWGSPACAAIAANVAGLSAAQTSNALGIAEYHSPDLPIMRDVGAPAMVKHGVGIGALTGLMAADLAARGFTGIASSLELDAFHDFVADLGESYLLPVGITWKRFCSCAWTHPALLALEALIAREGIGPASVEHILVETYPDAVRLGTRLPTTTEEAQFNMAWPLAVFLVDGEVGPRQVLEPRLASAKVRALCERVEVRVSDELTRLYYLSEANDPRGQDAAVVTLRLRDGRTVSSGVVEHVLYPEPAWSVDEMSAKFAWLTAGQLSKAAAHEILARVWSMEDTERVCEFLTQVTAALTPVSSPLHKGEV
jgi:2-methylcitrate dehydratase PrpD